jgi:hypothetical protein
MDGIWMDERDLEPEQPGPRLAVYELRTGSLERRERRADVTDFVRNVVHPGSALGDEFPDGRVFARRRQQLDASSADQHGRGFDALLPNARPVLDLGAEQTRVRVERLVEAFHGHAQMMDTADVHSRTMLTAPGQATAKKELTAVRATSRDLARSYSGTTPFSVG